MTPRQLRRAAERSTRKAARKTGFVNPTATSVAAPSSSSAQTEQPPPYTDFLNRVKAEAAAANDLGPLTPLDIPEPGFPFPSLTSISPARAEASRTNGALSQGPLTDATKSISAQNHTVHGLARHDETNFKIMTCEDAAAFIAFNQSLIDEHQPATPTEAILVQTMAQSHWLTLRSQRLQNTCIDPSTGAVTDEKKFTLYMRYQTTHKRAFHKSLNDLTKLRSEKRKAELGFEAQKVASEQHEMKKQSLYWDILKKDVAACRELSQLAAQNTEAGRANPGFEAQYEAELAKRGLTKNQWQAAAA